MLQHMEKTLIEIGFLDPNTPKQLMPRIQRLFQRAAPDKLEINILRGMLAAVSKQTALVPVQDTSAADKPEAQDQQEDSL